MALQMKTVRGHFWIPVGITILTSIWPGPLFAFNGATTQIQVNLCTSVFSDFKVGLTVEHYIAETSILSRFDPSHILDQNGIHFISSPGETIGGEEVFKVQMKTGEKYVVRLPSQKNSPAFEVFASDFIRHAPGGNTPSVRLLDQEKSRLFLEKLRQAMPHIKLRMDKIILNDRRVSVTILLEPDFETGSHFLRRARQLNNPYGFGKLPPRVKQELYDLWCLYEILGLSDFHPDNWMIKNEQVIGVDVGFVNQNFLYGQIQRRLFNRAEPFKMTPFTADVFSTLSNKISATMRDYLFTLDREQIRKIATEAEFPITEVQIDGILQKAAEIASGHRVDYTERQNKAAIETSLDEW